MKRARLLLVFLMVTTVFFAVACGSKPAATPAPAPAPAQQPAAGGSTAPAPAKVAAFKASISAAPSSGAWYPIAAAVGEYLQAEVPGTRVDIIEGGGNINPIAVQNKQTTFGVAQAFSAADAMKARPPFKEKTPDLRAVMALYDGVFQMAVLADSKINTYADLKGKRISAGVAGQATVTQMETVLEAFGLTFKDMARVEYVAYGDAATMMKDGQLDALTPGVTGYPVSALQDLASSRPIRLLTFTDDELKKVSQLNPAFVPAVIPANVYKGQDKEVKTFATPTILITRVDTPAEQVTSLLEAVSKNVAKFQKVNALMKDFSMERATKGLGIPMHPAAEAWFKGKGLIK